MRNKYQVPNHDIWSREEFLTARVRQLDSVKRNQEVIVIDTGADIFCDDCNVVIDTDNIILVNFGRRVSCFKCYLRLYDNEPLEFKTLNENGTLGDE